MTQEQIGQQNLLDLPEEVRRAYDTTVDTAIDQMKPDMPNGQRETNERLYATLQRVFTALDYSPRDGGTLVELGMGTSPYLPAIQAAFHPGEHIGIEVAADRVDAFHAAYPLLSPDARARIHTYAADATEPTTIPGFEGKRQADAIIALHPDISAYGKGDEAADEVMDDFKADPAMLTQMDNWRQRLISDGIMVVVTVFREEAEAIVSDERLNPYVHLYGPVAALSDEQMPYAAYVVVLRAAPRSDPPIVWRREQYRAYQEGAVRSPNENMFPDTEG